MKTTDLHKQKIEEIKTVAMKPFKGVIKLDVRDSVADWTRIHLSQPK
jgi:hypothetical protein